MVNGVLELVVQSYSIDIVQGELDIHYKCAFYRGCRHIATSRTLEVYGHTYYGHYVGLRTI